MGLRVILSSGVGRLHFSEVTLALKEAGVAVRLICGWTPDSGRFSQRVINAAGRCLGRRNLHESLMKRYLGGKLVEEDFCPLPSAEAVAAVAHRLTRLGLLPHGAAMGCVWRFFGYQSREYLKDADVFHVRSGSGQGGAIEAARRAGMKIVVDQSIAHPAYMHNAIGAEYARFGAVNQLSHENKFWQVVLKDCDEADVLLVNSDFVKQTFVDQGYDPSKIRVEHLGIPDYFYGAKQLWGRVNPDRVELLYTGGFVLRKGVRCLLEALDLLRKGKVSFRLTVAGDPTEAQRYLGELIREDVVLRGYLPREELRQLIRESDIYVFPTLSEGCAQSAMEALGAGLPVVTTAACGLPGVAGEHYALVPVNDPEELADKILVLADNQEERESLGRSGSKLLSGRYTWGNYAQRLVKIYEELLG